MFRRAITDITIENGQIAVSRKLDLSIRELEAQIAGLPYSGVGLHKDEKVEKAKLPPFALAFYMHIYSQRTIPTEDQFFERYISLSGELVENEVIIQGERYAKDGLRARLLRTYPSLIRDFHFYVLLSESKKFDAVRYSLTKDYFDGLDIEVVKEGQHYFISVYVETQRGNAFKKKKYSRHDYEGVPEITLGLKFSSLRKLGSIYVCSENHVDEVVEKIGVP